MVENENREILERVVAKLKEVEFWCGDRNSSSEYYSSNATGDIGVIVYRTPYHTLEGNKCDFGYQLEFSHDGVRDFFNLDKKTGEDLYNTIAGKRYDPENFYDRERHRKIGEKEKLKKLLRALE